MMEKKSLIRRMYEAGTEGKARVVYSCGVSMRRVLLIGLMMVLSGQASAQVRTAVFSNIWLEHNVMHNGQKCMGIHVGVTTIGMLGRTLTCSAYVESPKGTAHHDVNGNYRSSDGQVAASTSVNCSFLAFAWDDLVIWLPNDEIHPKYGKNDYYVHVEAWDGSSLIGKSGYASFTMTGTQSPPSGNNPANGGGGSACSLCLGTGMQTCNYCQGRGWDSYLGRCAPCSGTGRHPCFGCGGTGIYK